MTQDNNLLKEWIRLFTADHDKPVTTPHHKPDMGLVARGRVNGIDTKRSHTYSLGGDNNMVANLQESLCRYFHF